jgi:hypothetical protein
MHANSTSRCGTSRSVRTTSDSCPVLKLPAAATCQSNSSWSPGHAAEREALQHIVDATVRRTELEYGSDPPAAAARELHEQWARLQRQLACD